MSDVQICYTEEMLFAPPVIECFIGVGEVKEPEVIVLNGKLITITWETVQEVK